MQVGDLFKYRWHSSIHIHLDGCVGIVLSGPNKHGQYRVQMPNKVMYLLKMHMEKI
jgi:hypothetical protein